MSLITSENGFRALAIISVAALSACAAQEPLEYAPRPDMEEVGKLLDCPSDRTPTCVDRPGEPYSCFCMDEDALRKILEPDKY